jgi:hypothetical protein
MLYQLSYRPILLAANDLAISSTFSKPRLTPWKQSPLFN